MNDAATPLLRGSGQKLLTLAPLNKRGGEARAGGISLETPNLEHQVFKKYS